MRDDFNEMIDEKSELSPDIKCRIDIQPDFVVPSLPSRPTPSRSRTATEERVQRTRADCWKLLSRVENRMDVVSDQMIPLVSSCLSLHCTEQEIRACLLEITPLETESMSMAALGKITACDQFRD